MAVHQIASTEEDTSRGFALTRWTCVCGKRSRWVRTQYVLQSLATHARLSA